MNKFISTVFFIAITIFASSAYSFKELAKFRNLQAADSVMSLVQQTRMMFASQGDYTGLGEWASSGDVGDESSVAANLIKNYYTLSYPIVLGECEGQSGTGFMLMLSNLPQKICIDLHTKDWSALGNDFIGVGYNDISSSPYTYSEAQDLCPSTMADESNSFFMYFDAQN